MTVVQLAAAARWVKNLNGKLQNSNSDIWSRGSTRIPAACQPLTAVQSHSLIWIFIWISQNHQIKLTRDFARMLVRW